MKIPNMNNVEGHKICTRCIIDDMIPGVTFDEKGVCNYCHYSDQLANDFPIGDKGQQLLEKIASDIKKKGEGKRYDCIIGVSGGTDSTYTLYLANKLGLRPLAVHFDNGWNSEISVRNIKNALSKLNVDLQTYVVDWEEYKDFQKAYLKASLPWADAPTDLAITSTLYRVAAQHSVKYILIGQSFRTEGRMPEEWSSGDGSTMRYINKTFGTKPLKSFPNLTIFDILRYRYVNRIKLVKPLNYIDYSKSKARDVLRDELDWEYYGGHHYENLYTRFAYSFWLPQKFGIDKRIITHAALVRNGEMTREEGLNILQQVPLRGDLIEEDIEYVIKKLELTNGEFAEILKSPNKSYRDYPSYFPLFEKYSAVVMGINKRFPNLKLPYQREIGFRASLPPKK